MPGTYLLQRSGTSQFHWNLRSGNNEKILTSEIYNSKPAALTGIESCKANSPHDSRYKRLSDKSGSPYFVLQGANNEVIGVSEAYSSPAAREKGIESCKANGPNGTIDDRT